MILSLRKHKLVSIPPYTLYVIAFTFPLASFWFMAEFCILRVRLAFSQFYFSHFIQYKPGDLLVHREHSTFYVDSETATLLFVPYRGDIDLLSDVCLAFLLRYFLSEFHKSYPFLDHSLEWRECARGTCVIQADDIVDAAQTSLSFIIPRIILISGRLRSTQAVRRSPRYRLLYRLSYDGGHVFSKEEKEARAHEIEGNVQQVISVCFLWEFHSGIWP